MQDKIADDKIDRRGLLKCMTWIGTGLIWTVAGGVPVSRLLGESSKDSAGSGFSFVQISDSHIGFRKACESGRYGHAATRGGQDQRVARWT